jgi:hypothetical protein
MDDLVPLSDRRSGLGPPRFRLGTLLLLVTAVCLVLASYRWLGPYGATIIGLFVIAILAHIAGNYLGTQLREIGSTPVPESDYPNSPVAHGLAKGSIQPQHFAPASHLHARAPLPRAVLVTVACAFAAGACGGILMVWLFSPSWPTWMMFVCGATAFGVLAAIWSFLVAAFVQSGWKALSQALKDK